ncbi:MAG: YceI family protein [Flavipsychrobacter sp.]|nr:YceI family protein [Flavipsychrobacter sp.]
MKVLAWVMGFLLYGVCASAQIYDMEKGKAAFHSEAPQELISAESVELKGIVDAGKKSFAFRVNISSFMGFNSPLQREHFNENYMESNIFPDASFAGKIIEDIDFSKEGSYTVRAKGKLTIHGVPVERIVRADVLVKGGRLILSSRFIVSLADHNIKIPRVVSEKLSPDIEVTVNATLKQRP